MVEARRPLVPVVSAARSRMRRFLVSVSRPSQARARMGSSRAATAASFRTSILMCLATSSRSKSSSWPGSGGDADKGAGGIGGNVSGIFLPAMDLGAGNLVVAAGSGGSSVNATGGKGGILSTVQVIDAPDTANAGLATFASGTGGDGGKKGGIGGDILNLTVAGYNFDAAVTAGAGGSATISGAGANGGSVKNSGISVESDTVNNFVTVSAGAGGGSGSQGQGWCRRFGPSV